MPKLRESKRSSANFVRISQCFRKNSIGIIQIDYHFFEAFHHFKNTAAKFFQIKMDRNSFYLLLALISSIWARPQAGDVPNECSRFFKESAFDFSKLGFDQRTIEEKLVYK